MLYEVITHFLVLSLLERLVEMPATELALGLTLAAALLLHLCLEKPIDRWRQSRVERMGSGGRRAPGKLAEATAPAA